MLTLDRPNATPATALPVATPIAQPPRLLDRMRSAIRVRHYSLATERTYIGWVKRFIYFHQKRHPADMGAAEVEAFLSALATELEVSASTQNQAKHAILFLYRDVLGVTLPWLDDITSAKINKRLPVVLTVAETQALLRRLPADTNGLMSAIVVTTFCDKSQRPKLVALPPPHLARPWRPAVEPQRRHPGAQEAGSHCFGHPSLSVLTSLACRSAFSATPR